MYAATPCDGRALFDDNPTTAIVRHSSRILLIVSLLLISIEWVRRSRLCRLMCGKAQPFRLEPSLIPEAMPLDSSARRSLRLIARQRKGQAFPHIRGQSPVQALTSRGAYRM